MNISARPHHRLSKLALRLGLCAAALVGVAAPLTSAHAVVVTFDTPVAVPNNGDGLYLNFLTGAQGSSGADVPGWDWNPYTVNGLLAFFWGGAAGLNNAGVGSTVSNQYLDLVPGTIVSGSLSFIRSAQTAATPAFQTAGNHILGFSFLNESTSAVNYGYAMLTGGGAGGVPLTIRSWSFENSGGPITVVPEPSTGLMLSLGALALGALHMRRRRQQNAV